MDKVRVSISKRLLKPDTHNGYKLEYKMTYTSQSKEAIDKISKSLGSDNQSYTLDVSQIGRRGI